MTVYMYLVTRLDTKAFDLSALPPVKGSQQHSDGPASSSVIAQLNILRVNLQIKALLGHDNYIATMQMI